MDMILSQKDSEILRRLFARKMEIANSETNLARRRDWLALDNGESHRPMVLAEAGGIHDAVKPSDTWPGSKLECGGEYACSIEWGLRGEIGRFTHLKDDHVVAPWHTVGWKVKCSGYGVSAKYHTPDNNGHLAARNWDPALEDLDRDFHRLKTQTFSVDRGPALRERELLEKTFNGIGPVVFRGGFFWTAGLTGAAIHLIGLENLMLFMYDNPAGLHRLMAFLRDDMLAYTGWLEAEGLLSLNTHNDYCGSGSEGHTLRLPPELPEGTVKRKHCWLLSESQETVGVGPELFEEFIFPYQLDIAKEYGLLYYGCCEPVHTRWHVVKKFPNLARVSVSPWCDEALVAQGCGGDIVFSRKPNPTLISTSVFDENAIRRDLAATLDAARGCRVEFAMKDVHTLHNEPWRLARWVEIAREVCGSK